MKKYLIFTLFTLFILTACDNRTMRQVEADRIEECKVMIQTPLLADTSHLSRKERGQYTSVVERWDRCRKMVEDQFFHNEKKDNGWLNTDEYRYTKIGGKVIRGSRENISWGSGLDYFSFPYKWTHSYNYLDNSTHRRVSETSQENRFTFSMQAMSSYDISHKTKERAVSIDEVCKKKKPFFIWNDIIFIPSLGFFNRTENFEEEWEKLCPIAVEAVKTHLTLIKDTKTNP